MGLFDNDFDPGMRYESLMRDAFECRKMQDPFGYAAQEFYNEYITEPTTLRGKRALSAGLVALIMKKKGTGLEKKLIEIENKVWLLKTQQDVIALIDETIDHISEDNSNVRFYDEGEEMDPIK